MLTHNLALLALVALFQGGSAAQPQRVVALEWLPLGIQAEVLQSFEFALSPVPLERLSAYGDPAELQASVATLEKAPPSLIIGFGDRVCADIAARLPGVPLLAVSTRQDAWLKTAVAAHTAPIALFVTEPEPALVWDAAEKLLPGLPALAIIHTRDYAPNATLADALEKDAAKRDRRFVRITVPPGNCRTDSDFEKALDTLCAREASAVLYVPDDPNCSRFGDVICLLAAKRHIAVLGSEATLGKGCAAALTLDTEALGKECAEWAKHPAPTEAKKAPYRLVVDPRATAAQGLKPSQALKASSSPLQE